jgi:hypothetical protein
MAALGAGLASQACSGEVLEDASGAFGTSSTGSGTADGGGTGGSAPKVCSGKQGAPCDAAAWCAFDPPGSCGTADAGGLCQPRPEACTEDCPGVCGCDGNFYCNACGAQAAGVDVSSSKGCMAAGGEVSAVGLATNVPRFLIFKADPARDVCFRLMVEGFDGPGIGIMTPAGWSVGSAEVTDHASDCSLINGYPAPPIGSATNATGGTGSISIDGPFFPCTVTIHATLSFDAQAPWVPPTEAIDADQLAVSGGCG